MSSCLGKMLGSTNVSKRGLIKNNIGLRRCLYGVLVPVFNRVDLDRIREVGSDKACAEWLLRNGASIVPEGHTHSLSNYDLLQQIILTNTELVIEEVICSKATVSYHGFDHFKNCVHIRKCAFYKCPYVDDLALPKLGVLGGSLQILSVAHCSEVGDKGVMSLAKLRNLKLLELTGLTVKNKQLCMDTLTKKLEGCTINFTS